MIKARIRKIEGHPNGIAFVDHPTPLRPEGHYGILNINEGVVFDAEQPDIVEDQEFNTLIRLDDGRIFWVQSIDLEFHPFRGNQ